jgi:hypothetical protein
MTSPPSLQEGGGMALSFSRKERATGGKRRKTGRKHKKHSKKNRKHNKSRKAPRK